MFALFALHMIASAVLLDDTAALGTVLRVGIDPIRRLRIVRALFRPRAQVSTVDRCVPFERATGNWSRMVHKWSRRRTGSGKMVLTGSRKYDRTSK